MKFGCFVKFSLLCKKYINMQNSFTIDSKKLNLMQAIMAVDTEAVLDKMYKYFKKVTKDKDGTQELSEETLAMMEQSRKEFREGKVISFESAADAQRWLESL